jgi:anti-anti-sigma factor
MERRSEDASGCEVAWSAGCVTVSGEIDISNATVVGQRMSSALNSGDLVVDLRAVSFLDVAGFRMLTRLGAEAAGSGVAVRVRCSRAVIEMMRLYGMSEVPGLHLDCGGHDGPESGR